MNSQSKSRTSYWQQEVKVSILPTAKAVGNLETRFMMTHDWVECLNCKYEKALTHYSSCGQVNWIACPKCRKYFEHGKEIKPDKEDPAEENFWQNVIEDTGFIEEA